MLNLIKEIWELFIGNFKKLFLICLPFIILLNVLNNVETNTTDSNLFLNILFQLLQYIISSILIASLILYLSGVIYKENWQIRTLYSTSLLYAPYIFITNIIISLPFYINSLLFTYINSSLSTYINSQLSSLNNKPDTMFIISAKEPIVFLPLIFNLLILSLSLFIMLKASFTNFLIVLENNKPIQSIKESFTRTKGNLFKIIVLLSLGYLPFSFIAIFIQTLNSSPETNNKLLYFCGTVLVEFIIFSLIIISLFKIFHLSCLERNHKMV